MCARSDVGQRGMLPPASIDCHPRRTCDTDCNSNWFYFKSFGTVYQVKKKESGRSCKFSTRHSPHFLPSTSDQAVALAVLLNEDAMKVLSKEAIAKRNMSPHVLSERKILQLTHLAAASPFLVCLKFSFQVSSAELLSQDVLVSCLV